MSIDGGDATEVTMMEFCGGDKPPFLHVHINPPSLKRADQNGDLEDVDEEGRLAKSMPIEQGCSVVLPDGMLFTRRLFVYVSEPEQVGHDTMR